MTGVISHSSEDIIFLKKLIEEGKLKPVVDKKVTNLTCPWPYCFECEGVGAGPDKPTMNFSVRCK